jgi:hypothetical protein
MKQKLKPNRNICLGDREGEALRKIREIKDRIRDWSDSYVLKIYREYTAHGWREAAEEILKERGKMPKTTLTREQMLPKPKHPKPKKKKEWNRGTKEEQSARSTAWKLDRQLDQRIRDN